MKKFVTTAAVLAVALAGVAHAQPDNGPVIDIEIPSIVTDTGTGTGPLKEDPQLDLANVVQSAAKGVTTVQEAPVIVTVITNEEIADRQFINLEEIYDTVPGWMRAGLIHNMFPTALVRGQVQAVQVLQDGTSLFDPNVNVGTVTRVQPVETIKRIEMITGPGGVLWGSNSLVGILNVITKDAEDVDGVEVGGTLGGGPGDRNVGRAYFMYGDPDIAKGSAKLFLHGSFETYMAPAYQQATHMFSSPLPQPNSPIIEGPLTQADPPQSYIWTLDGKLTLGKLAIRFQVPFMERHMGIGFPGDVVRKSLGEDTLPACQSTDPNMWGPGGCIDPQKLSRDNIANFFDRFVVAEYRSRLAHGKAGIAIKAYGIQFVRGFDHLQVLEPVPAILQGGLAFNADLTSYRVGGAIDGDVELPGKARLLYGAEAFNEFMPQNVDQSRQGPGIQAVFTSPTNPGLLPVPCPLTIDPNTKMVTFIAGCPLTFEFPASRTVLGAYVDPQWRPSKKLILDAGARVQVAPASLGKQSYDPTLTASGTAVYNFASGYHLKLNFAQGFRPPVFNNMVSNGQAVELGGSPDLKVETSQAEQVEINGRIFKGERRIRELSFRADYSYTKIDNFIQLILGRYTNAGERGISSAEFLGKLYIQGGHRIELGYTWMKVDTADKGVFRSLPENWFNLAGVFNLVDGKLTATTNARVIGAMEDPNRMVEYRDIGYDQYGHVVSLTGVMAGSPTNLVVGPSELVLDRLPPQADIEIGMTYTPNKHMRIRATVYNAFNGRYFNPDAFGDYQPRLEFVPIPIEDFRAYLQASYTY